MTSSLANLENQVRFVGDMGTVLHAKSVKGFPARCRK
jgi:hypothetical protein